MVHGNETALGVEFWEAIRVWKVLPGRVLEAQPGPKAGLRSKTAHRILGAFGSYRTTSAICSRFKTSEALRRLSSFLYGSTHASLAPCLSEIIHRGNTRPRTAKAVPPHTRSSPAGAGADTAVVRHELCLSARSIRSTTQKYFKRAPPSATTTTSKAASPPLSPNSTTVWLL